jgi:hypothetical protein
MKTRLLLTALVSIFFIQASAGVIVVEGKYQLRNLFVLNGQSSTGVGFCVFEVTVNGDITTDEVNSDAFEVDLSQYGFELGDEIEVRIKHKDGCEPRVLNPEALEPMPTFDIKEITVSSDGLLEWETINEQGALPFIVQQFKWNKWVNLGEVEGVGTSNENSYQFKLVPVSGDNKVRVIQKSFNGKVRTSELVSFTSPKSEVTYAYDKKKDQITFSDETAFEIYNRYGQIAKRGYGKSVSVSNLRNSTYYLTYDSSMDEFVKK